MADCLVIAGATATGKTAVAIDVARSIGGEIISFDSRQVYRQMNIGTAKATPAQQAAVPHYGLDLVAPSERYNAGRFAADARGWIAGIRARGVVPILVGGSGFFLRALTHPLFREPPLEARRKEALKRFLNQKSRAELLLWLRHLDRQGAQGLSADAGRQRIARMIEVALLTGRSLHWWQQHAREAQPAIEPLTFVLELDRTQLYERINRRVLDMVNQGLIAEVEGLLAAGYDEHSPGMKTTGYIEVLPYLRSEYSRADAIDAIQRATRAYARRQITWFRHQLAEPVIRLDASASRAEIVQNIVREWQQRHAYRN